MPFLCGFVGSVGVAVCFTGSGEVLAAESLGQEGKVDVQEILLALATFTTFSAPTRDGCSLGGEEGGEREREREREGGGRFRRD